MPSPVPPSSAVPTTSPRVSVVIPLFNCLPLTQAMLASLQASLPRDLPHEIILVDDGSTDGTRAWLATPGSSFRVILNERNLGYAAANNRGAAAATGDLLVLLNNDLLLPRGWLEPMLALHRQLGGRAGVIGNVQRDCRTGAVDHTGIFINFKGKPEHNRHFPWWRLPHGWRRVDAVTGACLLIERKLWTQLGGFDETYLNGCEDVDLCLRTAAAGRVNAVSLRRTVRHHISASPGRKRRDEENTFRLVLGWRDTLVRLGAREWCRHYLETNWAGARDPADHAVARQVFLHLYRLRRHPPAFAVTAMNAAIDLEVNRWRGMFGPPSGAGPERFQDTSSSCSVILSAAKNPRVRGR